MLERNVKAWPQIAHQYGCSPAWIQRCAFLLERPLKATWNPGNSRAYFFVDCFAPLVSPETDPAARFCPATVCTSWIYLRFHTHNSNEIKISEFRVQETHEEIRWTNHFGSMTFAFYREDLTLPGDHMFVPSHFFHSVRRRTSRSSLKHH